MEFENLTGLQKAAILMIALGIDVASEVLKILPETDLVEVTKEIANLREVPSEIIDQVVDEFFELLKAQEFITIGGLEYASKVLQNAVGSKKAFEIVKKVQFAQDQAMRGFNLLKKADHNQILNLINNEHPQTIALILAYLEPKQAANILMSLPSELQQDVVYRIAKMEKIPADLLTEIETVLKQQLESVYTKELNEIGGTKAVAEILNMGGKTLEKPVLEEISKRNQELAQEIRGLMFTFEDIQNLDDRSIQRLLKEIDTKILTIALKGSTEEIQNKILANMSERAASMIKEEMEFLGPLRVKEVDEAQRQIVEIIRTLEEEGEIVIMTGEGGDEFIV
ncbi:MAG: flagellar motor switch protein FliG [candidate division KSB1 bacterium]|nr:flagellar motor switch protein FliG [candidate division KSB1 bacterium]